MLSMYDTFVGNSNYCPCLSYLAICTFSSGNLTSFEKFVIRYGLNKTKKKKLNSTLLTHGKMCFFLVQNKMTKNVRHKLIYLKKLFLLFLVAISSSMFPRRCFYGCKSGVSFEHLYEL